MTRTPSLLFLLALAGCGTSWQALDADGDGVTRQDGDCWDAVQGPAGSGLAGADIHPGAADSPYDGVDQDCDDRDDYDQDGDGYVPAGMAGLVTLGVAGSGALPEGDCWDDPAEQPAEHTVVSNELRDASGRQLAWSQPVAEEAHPGASDTWYDGVDQDCDGADDFDQDADSWRTAAYPDQAGDFGEDCIDGSPLDVANPAEISPAQVHPEAEEIWYDGTDQDCGGGSDDDQDGDGYDAVSTGGADCDDLNGAINPGAMEAWYDGVDQDCDGDSDYDADQDGFDAVDWAGDDCDDTDAATYPGAPEVWYDGADQDCAGDSDYDADQDGFDAVDWAGDDCDDSDPAVNPEAPEDYDGVDDDCDGLVDDLDVSLAAAGWLDGLAGDALGAPASIACGDIDGDGQLEILVGSALEESSRGLVWIVDAATPSSLHGTADSYAAITARGHTDGGSLATLDPSLADLTGDGQVDLAIAGTDAFDTSAVAVSLWEGGAGLPTSITPASALLTLTNAHGSEAGQLSAHLDVDGDGVAELIYGDWSAASGTGWGLSAVYLVKPIDWSGTVALDVACPTPLIAVDSSAELGRSLGGGDLDGDGYDELLVGAPGADPTAGIDAGEVALYLGPDPQLAWDWDDFSAYASLLLQGTVAGDRLGEGGLALCDPDADGALDLAVGLPGTDSVALFLAVGGLTGTHDISEADITLTGDSGSRFGQAVAVGDFDGDGVDDLSIGAPGATDPATAPTTWDGAAYLFTGPAIAAGADPAPMASLLDGDSGLLGLNLLATDLDADGRSDLVVTAPGFDSAAGRAWLVLTP